MPLDDGAFGSLDPVTGAEAIDIDQPARSAGAMTTGPVFTLANQLTLLRMLLIPAFVLLVVYGEFGLGAGGVPARRPHRRARRPDRARSRAEERAGRLARSRRPTSCCW